MSRSRVIVYDRGAWFLKYNHVKFARFVLLGVSEEEKKITSIFFRSMYNKTIIRFSFCGIQNNRGLGKGYQPKP